MEDEVKKFQENLKKLKIKHGAVKRMFADLKYYEKEEQALKTKLDDYKEKEECESTVKRQENLLKETQKVIPHIQENFKNYVDDLYKEINERFVDILQIREDKKIEFLDKYKDENVTNAIPNFTSLSNEVNAINETVSKFLLDINVVTLLKSGNNMQTNVIMEKEACVDI